MVKPLGKNFNGKVATSLARIFLEEEVIDRDLYDQITFRIKNPEAKRDTLFDELILGGDFQTYKMLKDSLLQMGELKLVDELEEQEKKVKSSG